MTIGADTGQSAGGGDVTTAQFEAEEAARIAGDEIQVETISRAASLVSFLRDQSTAAEAAIVRFTIAVTENYNGVRHTYAANDYVWFPPMSVDGKVFANIPPPVDITGKQDKLTNQQLAELLHMRLGVRAIRPTLENLKKPIEVFYDDPSILGPTLFAELTVAGFTVTPRVAMVQANGTARFTLADNQAKSLVNSKSAFLTANVAIYDALTDGNLVARTHHEITVIPLQTPPTVGTLTVLENTRWDTGAFLHANITLTINLKVTPLSGNDGDTAVLRVKQDATGGRTLAFSGVELAGRTVSIASGANAETEVFLYKRGATWKYMGSLEG